PRFLAKLNKNEKAFRVLSRIGGDEYAKNELDNIEETLQHSHNKKVNFKDLFNPRISPILLVGIVLAIFQQCCGINIIFNYAQEVFQAAGYNVNDMFLNIVITGGVNLIFTFVAMRTVDRWGR